VVSTVANPTLTTGNLVLNGITVAASGTSLGTLATAINTAAITGVTAAAVGGFLEIYVTSAAKSLGSAGAVDGKLVISSSTIAVGSATGLAAIALFQAVTTAQQLLSQLIQVFQDGVLTTL